MSSANRHRAAEWKAIIRFATQPDDPREIASQMMPLVKFDRIAVREEGDLEVVLRVEGDGAYDAARRALDRVEAATAETEFVPPELLEVNVLCLYGGVDPSE